MRHSVFDFILDLNNTQTINKRKTQDYYTIIEKFEFRMNVVILLKNE